jgi:hypothetical protein
VIYWRNNWADASQISTVDYSSLSTDQIDYWEVSSYDAYGYIVSYSRKKNDWTISTNYTIQLSINAIASNTFTYLNGTTGNTPFIDNEVVNFSSGGTAQVVISSNTGSMTVQHLQGVLNTGYVYGNESGANCTISAFNYLSNNIPIDVIAYWSPVTYYDMENEKNEGNKFIHLLKSDFVPSFVKSVKKLLSE